MSIENGINIGEVHDSVHRTDYKALFMAYVSTEKMTAQDEFFLANEQEFVESINQKPGSYLLLKSRQTAAGDAREQAIYKGVFEHLKAIVDIMAGMRVIGKHGDIDERTGRVKEVVGDLCAVVWTDNPEGIQYVLKDHLQVIAII